MRNSVGIRNFVHDQFNVHTNFNFQKYTAYLKALKRNGITEIEHAGGNIQYQKQKERLKNAIEVIHDLGMSAIFYTGVFGTENLYVKPDLERYAQRDNLGNVLSYRGKESKTAMMCPASPYVMEYFFPKLNNVLKIDSFDGIFIDIPWIMKNGCFCKNCFELKKNGANNSVLVRNTLNSLVSIIRKENPLVKICVNASAPTIHDNRFSGGHIDNLKGIFDEYLTEWNPYRWTQNVSIVTRCIEYARKTVNRRLLHATTATNRQGKLYTADQYVHLFDAILKGGATPRLGIGFPEEQLKIIGSAWGKALSEY